MLRKDSASLQPYLCDAVPSLMSTSLRIAFKLQPRCCGSVLEVTSSGVKEKVGVRWEFHHTSLHRMCRLSDARAIHFLSRTVLVTSRHGFLLFLMSSGLHLFVSSSLRKKKKIMPECLHLCFQRLLVKCEYNCGQESLFH